MTDDDRHPDDQPDPDRPVRDEGNTEPGDRCWNCGATLPDGAMFCGECGSAVGARASRQPTADEVGAGEDDGAAGVEGEADDIEVQPVGDPDASGLPPHGDALLDALPDASDPPGVSEERLPEPTEDQDDSGTPPHGDALLDPEAASAWSSEGPGAEPDGDASEPAASEPDVTETDVVPAVREDESGDSVDPLAPLTAEERFAAERLLDPHSDADKFVLQFSTGESATVFGSGLIGRNPVAEPGEYVDQLVVIRDPGRSVSKTHLEFGQDSGAFWVLDRFSGNGSALREPDAPSKRCEPGRRYFVSRGTRVEIGDQFFVVS